MADDERLLRRYRRRGRRPHRCGLDAFALKRPRLVFGEAIGRRTAARLLLEIGHTERLAT